MSSLTLLERLGRRVPLYIQIKRGWLSVTDPLRDITFETHTRFAFVRGDYGQRKRFQPRPASKVEIVLLKRKWGDDLVVTDGLSHPRSPIDDPEAVEGAMTYAIQRVLQGRWQKPGRMIIHLRDTWEGGYTYVETRAFRDCAVNVGATQLMVLKEPTSFSNHDVLALLNGTYSGPARLAQ